MHCECIPDRRPLLYLLLSARRSRTTNGRPDAMSSLPFFIGLELHRHGFARRHRGIRRRADHGLALRSGARFGNREVGRRVSARTRARDLEIHRRVDLDRETAPAPSSVGQRAHGRHGPATRRSVGRDQLTGRGPRVRQPVRWRHAAVLARSGQGPSSACTAASTCRYAAVLGAISSKCDACGMTVNVT
jgi:hypothetical protein